MNLGLRNRAVLARRGERTEDVSRIENGLAQAPVGRRLWLLRLEFYALQKESAFDEKAVVIRFGDALDAGAAGGLVSDIDGQAKDIVFYRSPPCAACSLCSPKTLEST